MADTQVPLSGFAAPVEKVAFGIPIGTVVGLAATGANTATIVAEANKQHLVYTVTISFGATIGTACTLTISDGSTVIWQLEIPTATSPLPIVVDFGNRPLHGSNNAAVQAALTTPGAIKSAICLSYNSVRTA